MNRGILISGIGHLGLILWVILGDWLFLPSDMPEIQVAEVSLVSAAEFDAMSSAAPHVPETKPQPKPVAPAQPEVQPAAPAAAETPAPAQPVPEAPEAAPLPETVPVSPDPQPLEAPPPLAPLAAEEQPIPVPTSDMQPAPRPIDRVAAVPVDQTRDAPEIADTPTPQISDTPSPDAPVVEPAPDAAPLEAAPQIVTEATDTQTDAPQLAPTSSRRPQSRPVQVAEATPPDQPAPDSTETATDPLADAVAGAVAAAVADASASDSSPPTPSGPPMTSGEIDGLRVAVKQCWNLGALSSEAMQVTVTVRLDVAQDGKPDAASIRMTGFDGGSEAVASQMFEVARRAIIRCGKSGFPLPAEKYDTWKDLELVFDPNGMRLR